MSISALSVNSRGALIWRAVLPWLLGCIACVAQAEEYPVVFMSTDTPPFFSAGLPDNGFAGAVLHLVSERAGVEYRIEYLPVKRFRNSEATYIVGDPELLMTQKRKAIFPIALFNSALFFYKPHHEMIEYRRVEDLGGHTLGVLRGTVEDKRYLTDRGIRVYESDSVESLLRMLKRGRVDFCILVQDTGTHFIRKLFPQESDYFDYRPIPDAERPIAIMIDMDTPGGAAVAARYGKVLRRTLEGAEYRKILDTYWGSGKISEGYMPKLKRFVEFYSLTWEE